MKLIDGNAQTFEQNIIITTTIIFTITIIITIMFIIIDIIRGSLFGMDL